MYKVILIILLAMTGVVSSRAQSICDVYGWMPGVSCHESGDIVTLSFDGCNAAIEFNQSDGTLVLIANGQRTDLRDTDIVAVYTQAFGECGNAGITSGSPLDPSILSGAQNFQNMFSGARATTRSGEDDEAAVQQAIAFNALSANVGGGSFDLNGSKGSNSNGVINFRQAYESGYTLGANVFYNRLSFDAQSDSINNWTGSLSLQKNYWWKDLELTSGVTYTYLMLDNDYSPDDGQALALDTMGVKTFGSGHVLSGGLAYQYGEIDRLHTGVINLGGNYGIPTGQYGVLNATATYTTISQDYDGASVNNGLDNSFLTTSLIYDYYIGSFVVNLGLKKVLLMDGYSNTEWVLSGRLRR